MADEEVTAENVEASPLPDQVEDLDVDNVDLSRVAGAKPGEIDVNDGEPVPVGNEKQRKYAEKVASTFKKPGTNVTKDVVKPVPTPKPVPKPVPKPET